MTMSIKKSSGGKPAPRWPLDPNALQKAAVFLSTPFAMKQSTTNQDIFPAAFRGSKARYISISSQRRSLARTTLAECKTNANSKSQSEIQHPSLRMSTLIAVHKELPAIVPRGMPHRFFRGKATVGRFVLHWYTVFIPVTPSGLHFLVCESPSGGTMFTDYKRDRFGQMAYPEKHCIFRSVGDTVVAVDGASCLGQPFQVVVARLRSAPKNGRPWKEVRMCHFVWQG